MFLTCVGPLFVCSVNFQFRFSHCCFLKSIANFIHILAVYFSLVLVNIYSVKLSFNFSYVLMTYFIDSLLEFAAGLKTILIVYAGTGTNLPNMATSG